MLSKLKKSVISIIFTSIMLLSSNAFAYWIPAHRAPDGVWIEGHYSGWVGPGAGVYVPPHPTWNGGWMPGHYAPGPIGPGYRVWVPGHTGPEGAWIPGHYDMVWR